MSTTVTFADLTHTAVAVDANNNPLAVGYIAAYARRQLGSEIAPHLFKYPASLARFLGRHTPAVACFTNYMWNERLSCAFAREIKRAAPRTIVVMGGPNYPVDAVEQQRYLEAHPEIDFFADGEGEVAFVNLFRALSDAGFDGARLRSRGTPVAGIHYVAEGRFVRGETLARILDLDATLPSPYTMGLLDEFFDDRLTPMMQTSRGCPYGCTFCHDGIAHMNKTRAFSPDRVDEELAYIETRVRTPTLQLADLNWGMFPGDLRTAQRLAESRRRTGWPRNVMVATAKNQKERIVEMSRVLGDALQVGASVQSTDPEVLRLIKRSNISLDAIVKMSTRASQNGTGSFTEIILGLPGDTRDKHIKTVCDMLDAGIEDLRLFQFILLPGTEANDVASRRRHQYRTGFRVLARGFGRYEILGRSVPAAEIQEVCLGTDTMPEDDYLACRAFDLTISIFNNAGILREFFRAAEALGVRRSTVLRRIFLAARDSAGPIACVYDEFHRAEAKNFFGSREALERFLAAPGGIEAYLRGEYGVNHIYKARTTALVRLLPEVMALARAAAEEALAEAGIKDALIGRFFDELTQLSLARKSDLTAVDREIEITTHFDFPALHAVGYRVDPRRAYVPQGLRLRVAHTAGQRADLRKYFAQYGTSLDGLGQFLQRNDSHLNGLLYRQAGYVDDIVPLDLRGDVAPAVALATPALDAELDQPLLGEGTFPAGHGSGQAGLHPLRLVKTLGPLVVGLCVGLSPTPAGTGHIRPGATGRAAGHALVHFVRRPAA